jgi:hypothetical protein
MASCRHCDISVEKRELEGGLCGVCEAEAAGEQPTYTLPDDEWAEMSPDDRKAARAKGIRPQSAYYRPGNDT